MASRQITGRFERDMRVGILALLFLSIPSILLFAIPEHEIGEGVTGTPVAILMMVCIIIFFILGFAYGGYIFKIPESTKNSISYKKPLLGILIISIFVYLIR